MLATARLIDVELEALGPGACDLVKVHGAPTPSDWLGAVRADPDWAAAVDALEHNQPIRTAANDEGRIRMGAPTDTRAAGHMPRLSFA